MCVFMTNENVIKDNNEKDSGEKKFRSREDRKRFFEIKKGEKFGGKFARKDKKFGNKFFKGKRDSFRDEMKSKDRISKRLAMLGVASRREADKMVTDGKIKINGVVCKDLGFLVSYEDKISVNNKEIANKPIRTKIYTFNKPSGYVTTNNDPQGRKTIFELIPSRFGRLITIGRLDMNTEGLLLLTNNGELARIMEMPATGLKRIYYAKVIGSIDEKMKERLEGLRKGIKIEGTEYGKMIVEIESVSPTAGTLKIVIFEGKNNEIRRIMWHLGLKVVKLTRVQYGDFKLFGLPSGCISESRIRVDIKSLERRASINAKRYNERMGKIRDKQCLKDKDDNAVKEENITDYVLEEDNNEEYDDNILNDSEENNNNVLNNNENAVLSEENNCCDCCINDICKDSDSEKKEDVVADGDNGCCEKCIENDMNNNDKTNCDCDK